MSSYEKAVLIPYGKWEKYKSNFKLIKSAEETKDHLPLDTKNKILQC